MAPTLRHAFLSAGLWLAGCGRLGYGELPATAAGSGGPAAVEIDAAPSCTPVAARDYCSSLPALPDEPVLDGVLDCGPSLSDLPVRGWTSLQRMPSGQRARYAVAWRPNGLYFYVEVADPQLIPARVSDKDPWCGDGVELYVDSDGQYGAAPAYDDPGTMQLLAAAPARDSSTQRAVDARYHTRSELRVGDWAGAHHVTIARDAGYALEAFVRAADLDLSSWHLAAGDSVGLDLAIDVSTDSESVSGDCGHRLGQYFLSVARTPCLVEECRPYLDVDAFCKPRLE